MNAYTPAADRYQKTPIRRCGRTGLRLPALSLGLWHNFGDVDNQTTCRELLRAAFDNGVFHFDLANNYGPPAGSAEENFGHLFKKDFTAHRDELVISSKAGYYMWPGPYGDGGSRKYIVASCDQSLKRMGLDYVDIFYHHRPDGETDLEESMLALDHLVRTGRALYVGISNYDIEQTKRAVEILRANKTPFVIHQVCVNLLNRTHEHSGLLSWLADNNAGAITFSPLAQGLLGGRYLDGSIPADSRVARGGFLKANELTPERLAQIRALNDIAVERGQTLAQLSLSWLLSRKGVTSVLVGASRVSQLMDSLGATHAPELDDATLARIDAIAP